MINEAPQMTIRAGHVPDLRTSAAMIRNSPSVRINRDAEDRILLMASAAPPDSGNISLVLIIEK